MDATMDVFCIRVAHIDTNEGSLQKPIVSTQPATLLPRAAGLVAAQQEQSLSHGKVRPIASCLDVALLSVLPSMGPPQPSVRVPSELITRVMVIVPNRCHLLLHTERRQ